MTDNGKTVLEEIAKKAAEITEPELIALNAFVLGFVAGTKKENPPA